MKTTYCMWMAAAFLTVAASCSNDKTPVVESDELEVKLNLVHPASRVTDTDFEAQDKIGVYMVAEGTDLQIGGNEVNNELFSYKGTDWTSERKVYWNEGLHDIYAYYPYVKSISDTDNYPFTISLDQSLEGTDGISEYEASDFLWASSKGVSATADAVPLQFRHCMSKLKVVLVKGSDYEGEIPSDCEVYIHNMKPSALIDLQEGSVEVSPYAAVETVKCRKLNNTEFTACLVPQRLASRRPFVEVVTSNVSYMLEGTISLKQGYQSTVTVTLSQSPEQVEITIGGGIENWE